MAHDGGLPVVEGGAVTAMSLDGDALDVGTVEVVGDCLESFGDILEVPSCLQTDNDLLYYVSTRIISFLSSVELLIHESPKLIFMEAQYVDELMKHSPFEGLNGFLILSGGSIWQQHTAEVEDH